MTDDRSRRRQRLAAAVIGLFVLAAGWRLGQVIAERDAVSARAACVEAGASCPPPAERPPQG